MASIFACCVRLSDCAVLRNRCNISPAHPFLLCSCLCALPRALRIRPDWQASNILLAGCNGLGVEIGAYCLCLSSCVCVYAPLNAQGESCVAGFARADWKLNMHLHIGIVAITASRQPRILR